MKAAVYARVSSSNGSQTCENQLLELRRYCEARGWTVHAEYTDEMSGAKDRRPGLDRLLLDARRARVQIVVCWALDRIGRDLTSSGRAGGPAVAEHSICVVERRSGSWLRQRPAPTCNSRRPESVRTRASEGAHDRGARARSGARKAPWTAIRAGAGGKARGGERHLSARGRETPRSRQVDPSALASTGPTKPLCRSLTFRLRIRTNQGHVVRAGWPDHSVVCLGRITHTRTR